MADPISIIGLAPIAYATAVKAWAIVADALSFSEDSEDLVIRLECARARFDIWASLSSLVNGKLEPRLMPFESLIERLLKRIDELFSNTDRLRDKYGLSVEERAEPDAEKQAGRISRMRRNLRAANSCLIHAFEDATIDDELGQSRDSKNNPSTSSRIRWAVKDKKTFEGFISLVEAHVDGLQKLLTESQQKDAQQEVTRFELRVIGSFSDMQSLSTLQKVGGFTQERSQIDLRYMAQWKVLSQQQSGSTAVGSATAEELSLARSPLTDRMRTRFLRRGAINQDECYLLEKKEYDSNITIHDKDMLEGRIQRLVSLLSAPNTDRELHSLQAVGYIDDPEVHCWWIAFRFPLPPIVPNTIQLNESQPISLRRLYATSFKPPLEKRYQLARRVAHTFAKLYGSDWMHKSISSDNIIFPQIYDQSNINSFRAISSALVQGFGYSRQHTEAQTIDRGKALGDLESAIYRHPNYQGAAASGYRIQYDIYSFGLVLFEIATWAPLVAMLAAVTRQQGGDTTSVQLSPAMGHFHQAEALELERRVMLRVDKELAFRVGTMYSDAVRWCLTFYRSVLDNGQPWQAAIEFYNHVVVPLDELLGE